MILIITVMNEEDKVVNVLLALLGDVKQRKYGNKVN
jgi:hypothetical protein